jgi:hypothetical protein
VSRVLGVYIHIQQGRHRLVWVLLDAAQVIEHGDLRAPTEPEDRCLGELETRVSDLLQRLASGANAPELLALRLHDVRRYGGGITDDDIRVPAHAEGVVLAAAAQRRLPVAVFSAQKLGGAAGVAKRNAAVVPKLADAELAQATAAAREAGGWK